MITPLKWLRKRLSKDMHRHHMGNGNEISLDFDFDFE